MDIVISGFGKKNPLRKSLSFKRRKKRRRKKMRKKDLLLNIKEK